MNPGKIKKKKESEIFIPELRDKMTYERPELGLYSDFSLCIKGCQRTTKNIHTALYWKKFVT